MSGSRRVFFAFRISVRPVTVRAKSEIVSLILLARVDLGNHLAIIGGRAEELRLEIDDPWGSRSTALAKSLTAISGRLGTPDEIQDEPGFGIVRPRRPDRIEQALGVAQIGEIGRRDHDNLVGAEDQAAASKRSIDAECRG